MTQTKLQTKVANLALQRITVNGHSYDVDRACCVYVDNAVDIAKLKLVGWSDKITVIRGAPINRVPQSGQSLRSATEFVALLQQDQALREKVATIRTFPALAAFVLDLGFKFTQAEFQAAGQAFEAQQKRAAEIDAANAKTKIKKVAKEAVEDVPEEKIAADESEEPTSEVMRMAPDENAKGLVDDENTESEDLSPVDDSGFTQADELPETLPEEVSGAWPDPSEVMSLPYLRRMADAYDVKYPANISKHKLVLKLNEVVFTD